MDARRLALFKQKVQYASTDATHYARSYAEDVRELLEEIDRLKMELSQKDAHHQDALEQLDGVRTDYAALSVVYKHAIEDAVAFRRLRDSGVIGGRTTRHASQTNELAYPVDKLAATTRPPPPLPSKPQPPPLSASPNAPRPPQPRSSIPPRPTPTPPRPSPKR